MSVFGTSTNPHAATGGGLFSGPMQENHTIPREVFSGNNAQYASARRFLTLLGFDGENAARNANWAPANEADALSLQSAMHRGSHPEYSKGTSNNAASNWR